MPSDKNTNWSNTGSQSYPL